MDHISLQLTEYVSKGIRRPTGRKTSQSVYALHCKTQETAGQHRIELDTYLNRRVIYYGV